MGFAFQRRRRGLGALAFQRRRGGLSALAPRLDVRLEVRGAAAEFGVFIAELGAFARGGGVRLVASRRRRARLRERRFGGVEVAAQKRRRLRARRELEPQPRRLLRRGSVPRRLELGLRRLEFFSHLRERAVRRLRRRRLLGDAALFPRERLDDRLEFLRRRVARRLGPRQARREPRAAAFAVPALAPPMPNSRGVYFNLVKDWEQIGSNMDGSHVLGFFLQPNPTIVLFTTAMAGVAAVAVLAVVFCLVFPSAERRRRAAGAVLLEHLRPGGCGSLLVAYLIHWLPYATQNRQTFLIYYLPAFYFAILLAARTWDHTVCRTLSLPAAAVLTLCVCVATGHVSWRISAIAYASPVKVHDWTGILRLASTECWWGAKCWVNQG